MIVVHDPSGAKRKFLLCKSLITEDGRLRVTVWFQWVTRHDRDCASWLWVTDDGQRFVEHISH